MREKQMALDGAEATAAHWRDEWKSLAEETGDMVRETFEILMDQVRHLNPAIDFSMISLDSRWDPKAKRIYNPEAEAQEQSEPVAEERPDLEVGVPIGGDVREVVPEAPVKEGGECPMEGKRVHAATFVYMWYFLRLDMCQVLGTWPPSMVLSL
ncbi:hypothetical protein PIB30_024629 [Stylosanthes scabra]|uniref:Uncharacterized protein n=1 Tax=Stylosanthes scabra TaxID=79078 RepID=A0ABU6WBP6_9FABA|nr:hypothetical protein [Stylosanthes scabra]